MFDVGCKMFDVGCKMLKETMLCNYLSADSCSPSLMVPDACLNPSLRQKVNCFTTTLGIINLLPASCFITPRGVWWNILVLCT